MSQQKGSNRETTQNTSSPADHSAPPGYVPIDPEVEAWAERERIRRRAWLEGPTDKEKAEVRRRMMARFARQQESPTVDIDELVRDWAERENAHRKAWAEGPSLYRQAGEVERGRDLADWSENERSAALWNLISDIDLATRAFWARLINRPLDYLEDLVEEGRARDERPRSSSGRLRVPF